MPSTRRTVLRTGLLGVVGTLAGCSGDKPRTETEATTTNGSTLTAVTSTTSRQTPDETTIERPTTVRSPPQAMEFAHRNAVLDSGITDVDSDHFARRIGTRRELADLDLTAAREDVQGQDLTRVAEFAEATNFKETDLLVVQMRTPSPTRELDFAFLDPWPTPQVVVRTRTNSDRGRGESEDAISTLLVRIPARMGPPSVTVADLAGVRDEPQLLTTFAPPNVLRSEARITTALDGVPTPSAVVTTSQADARRLLPESDAHAEFVAGTDFERTYLLAVQTRIRSGGVFAWPTVVARRDGHAVIELWQYPFAGGPNAEFDRLVLARIRGDAPKGGTATIRRSGRSGAELVRFSSDPAEWSSSGGDKSK